MKAAQVFDLLRRFESRNVTFLAPDGSWPIVWKRARGCHVWDLAGRRYLDLTAAFGVAAAGHANARVVAAAQRQSTELLHAMGDVHPHAGKAKLVRELSRITFERWTASRPVPQRLTGKVLLGNSGFEAVEAALKTARLATGKPEVIAFEGGYHGLGYGTLVVGSREHFRAPFQDQLGTFGHFLPFPEAEGLGDQEKHSPPRARTRPEAVLREIDRLCRQRAVGAILLEPIQARGGIRVPPPGFLSALRALGDRRGVLLVLDEIYTGFGRTGHWFACEAEAVVPDLICLGKALTGGFPLSACVGRAAVMDAAWPPSTGEAIHTSTYLGHPVGCAMALAQIGEIRRRRLPERARRLGLRLHGMLEEVAAAEKGRGRKAEVRGVGLMAGLALYRSKGEPDGERSVTVVQRLLQRGVLALPEGVHGEVVGLTPPLTIPARALDQAIRALAEALDQC